MANIEFDGIQIDAETVRAKLEAYDLNTEQNKKFCSSNHAHFETVSSDCAPKYMCVKVTELHLWEQKHLRELGNWLLENF